MVAANMNLKKHIQCTVLGMTNINYWAFKEVNTKKSQCL